MKNLKIGKRLIRAFIILLIFTSIGNVYSIIQINKMNELDNQLFTGPYIDTSESGGLRRDLANIARNINNIFLYDENEHYADLILSDFESMTKRIEKLHGSSSHDNEIIEKIESATEELRKEYDKIYAVTQREGFSGSISEIDEVGFTNAFNEIEELTIKFNEEAEVMGTQFNKNITNLSKKMQTIAILLNIAAIVVGLSIAIYITKSLVSPIKELELAANKMKEGDFDIDISYESKDELGVLSSIIMELSIKTKDIIEDTSNVLREVASGNFDVQTQAEYIGVFESIENSLNLITEGLSETMSQIGVAAQEVEAASSQVSSTSQVLAQGATEQAGAIEELSATISDVSKQIQTTADNARKANSLTLNASREVEEGNKQMKQMIEAMDDISESSREIGRIIKTIDDIAFQTNILALNAAVEAARAGSAGKGFAVVADEVRNLAAKSAQAAQNTSQLIENSINAVDNGSDIVNNTAVSLQKIIKTTSRTGKLVEDIAKSCEEETTAISQITTGIEQISQVVQTNSATSEESAAGSQELSGQAQMLNSLIESFKLKNKYNNQNSISFTDEGSDYFADSKI